MRPNKMAIDSVSYQLTPGMIDYYLRRTQQHIARVRRNLRLYAAAEGNNLTDLLERADVHDESKFSEAEFIPYAWLTHKYRPGNSEFEYPNGVEELIKAAVDHHYAANDHHPEHYADVNDMSDAALIEMVCDWTAMAQEFGEAGGSAKNWADKVIGHKYAFDDAAVTAIYRIINRLDRAVHEAGKQITSEAMPPAPFLTRI